jgi:hypothetical protein
MARIGAAATMHPLWYVQLFYRWTRVMSLRALSAIAKHPEREQSPYRPGIPFEFPQVCYKQGAFCWTNKRDMLPKRKL